MLDNKYLTDEEQLNRMWDREVIQNLMGRHTYLYASDARAEELETLWVKTPEHRAKASLGSNWGFYVGYEAIWDYYVEKHKADRIAQLREYAEKVPGLAMEEGNLGFGAWDAHTLSTPFIQLAGDGQSARGLWYDNGQTTVGRPDGAPEAYFVCGLVAADFLKEDGEWKIFHLMLANDMAAPVGEDYAKIPTFWDQDPVKAEFGQPTVPELVHNSVYGWGDTYPFLPEPYETYRDEDSYGPLGKRARYYTIDRSWDIKSCIENDKRGGIHEI